MLKQIQKELSHDWIVEMHSSYRLFENHTDETIEYIVLDADSHSVLNFELYYESLNIKHAAWDTKFHVFFQEKKISIYSTPDEEVIEECSPLKEQPSKDISIHSIKVEVGSDFIPFLFEKEKEEEIKKEFELLRYECKGITGVEIPKVHLCDNLSFPPKKVHITINDTVVFSKEGTILFSSFSIEALCNRLANLIYNYLHSHS